jgi:hypothetical protein
LPLKNTHARTCMQANPFVSSSSSSSSPLPLFSHLLLLQYLSLRAATMAVASFQSGCGKSAQSHLQKWHLGFARHATKKMYFNWECFCFTRQG